MLIVIMRQSNQILMIKVKNALTPILQTQIILPLIKITTKIEASIDKKVKIVKGKEDSQDSLTLMTMKKSIRRLKGIMNKNQIRICLNSNSSSLCIVKTI